MDTPQIKLSNNFLSLPQSKTSGDEIRSVGFEFEFTGIPLWDCAQLLADKMKGRLEKKNALTFVIHNTTIGTIKLKADWQLAQKISQKDLSSLPRVFQEFVTSTVERFGRSSKMIIPWEIITEPLKPDQFSKLEDLRSILFENEALGTIEQLTFAFGTHINTEVISDDVQEILDTLRAFLLLYPSLVSTLEVDSTRRLLSYISPFSKEYAKIVLNPSYKPDWRKFSEDYIRYQPTRNSALDLLPLITHFHPDIRKLLNDSTKKLVNARPAYHYRLPNCELSNPHWRISQVWNSWVAVEQLAADKKTLHKLSKERLYEIEHPILHWFRSCLHKRKDS